MRKTFKLAGFEELKGMGINKLYDKVFTLLNEIKDYYGYSYDKISAEIKISRGTLYGIMHKGNRNIKIKTFAKLYSFVIKKIEMSQTLVPK